MKQNASKRKAVSMGRWYLLTTVALFLPVMLAIFIVSFYVGSTLRQQAVAYNEEILSLYMEQLENSARGLERYLASYPTSNYDVSTLALSTNERDRYLASKNILGDISQNTIAFDNFDGFYVYSVNPVNNLFLCTTTTGTTGDDLAEMRLLAETAPDREDELGWFLHSAGGSHYMVRIARTGSTYCGAWINLRSITLPLDRIDNNQASIALLTNGEGQVLTGLGGSMPAGEVALPANGEIAHVGGEAYLTIGRPSSLLPISLHVLIPDNEFASKSQAMQAAILVIFLIALCVVPLIAFFFSRSLYSPVRRLVDAMHRVEKGDLTVQVDEGGRFTEFNDITGNFNRMITQIKRLEQDVYLRTISEQKTQLDYLQLQIKPHFFLNTLNVIYSFALVKREDLVEKMVVCLTKYFRYMFQSATALVPLRAELEHMENYMEIQELRFPGNFVYEQQVDGALLDAPIPPVMIQTFIENSIKYALDIERTRVVRLSVECAKKDGIDYMHITIEDNGKGYPADYLQQAQDTPRQDTTRQIGIWNARQRLKLMYGQTAWIALSNNPLGGAVSELMIPLAAPDGPVEEVL